MTSIGRVPFSFRAQFHVDANPVYRDLRRIFALLCHNFCCGEANNPLTPEQIREALSADGLLFDTGITRHGFTPYMRDYEVVVVVPRGSQHILKFSHCPFVEVVTTVRDDLWRCSWDDVFTDYAAWKAAGEPEGYVWGVCDSEAYPGPTYLEDSKLAQEWTSRLGKLMHEVLIRSNAYNIRLLFHDLHIAKLQEGNAD
jgi:hypothetical protein